MPHPSSTAPDARSRTTLLDVLQPDSGGEPVTPLRPDAPRARELLDDLQGHILRPHGKTFSKLHFVRFRDAEGGRRWTREVGELVTTMSEQLGLAPSHPAREGCFVGLYLTATGMIALGAEAEMPRDRAFVGGMLGLHVGGKTRAEAILGDSLDEWRKDDYLRQIDALLIIAFDGNERAAASDLIDLHVLARPEIVEVAREFGGRLFDPGGRDAEREVENFGFRDGLSRMLFLEEEGAPRGKHWDGYFPLRQVLVPMRLRDGREGYGSYLVYRKLRQEIARFEEGIRDLAARFFGGTSRQKREQARAWVVGRFRDGTPLVLDDKPSATAVNDFTYHSHGDARTGAKCPLHAHMRKMNPRGDFETATNPSGGLGISRSRLPVRRSVPFGERVLVGDVADRILDVDTLPAGTVGHLFMAFVRDITFQFEHLMEVWANQPGFPFPGAAADPLIGSLPKGLVEIPGRVTNGVPPMAVFHQCIIAQGGGYFFAPPRSFLQSL